MRKLRVSVPSQIRLAQRTLDLTYDELGAVVRLPYELLRVYSPSAEVRAHDGRWNVPPLRATVRVEDVEPIGNYAVRLIFSDRHDTGIFSYALLEEMGRDKFRFMRAYLRQLKAQGKQRRRRQRRPAETKT